MKRVGMCSGLIPFSRGFGSGTRYAVSFPASRVCFSVSVEGKMMIPLSELVRREVSGNISNPASRAFADENKDPFVGEGSGLRVMLPFDECERT